MGFLAQTVKYVLQQPVTSSSARRTQAQAIFQIFPVVGLIHGEYSSVSNLAEPQ
jgi:hypothetical protein